MPSTRSLLARVIVADDYLLFRDGPRRVVRHYLPQAAVSEADSFDEMLYLVSGVSPGPPALFVLDLLLLSFAASQSIERLCRTYRCSTIVIVSMLGDPRLVDEMLAASADDCLDKSLETGEIGTVLQTSGSGEPVVRLHDGLSAGSRQRALLDTLTSQQQAVLRLITDGLSNKEIGCALPTSPFIMHMHVFPLLRILEVSMRTATAALAVKTGFQTGSTRPYPEFLRKHSRVPKREVCRGFPRSLLTALKPGAADQSHP